MDLQQLIDQIRYNCAVSDAKFWGSYSLCGLLMRYRELYRSEHRLMPWEPIPGDGIASWIDERERLWKRLEEEELKPLAVEGAVFDPFDAGSLNRLLKSAGLIYGSGYGIYLKPAFFLARLLDMREYYDYQVFYIGKELCRDLSAAPAMLQGRCIYVRTDLVRAFLWDKLQELGSCRKRQKNDALPEEFVDAYGKWCIEPSSGGTAKGMDEAMAEEMEKMVRGAAELFVLHEAGEAFEDSDEEEWRALLVGNSDRSGELYARGIKDLAADTSIMGPLRAAVVHEDAALLSFYRIFFGGLRKELFPEIRTALQQFGESRDWSLIEEARAVGYKRSRTLSAYMLDAWRAGRGTEGVREAVRRSLASGAAGAAAP